MSSNSQFRLLGERRFLPLFLTQFFGAANDNVLKNAMVILISFQSARLGIQNPDLWVNLCAGVFILPMFLFSASAGQFADKFEKSRIIRLVKLIELGIMLIAGAGFLLPNITLLMVALFLMGMHSTLFGPVKYSILPQHLADNELIAGNALIESGTFLAILIGTILGGTLAGMGEAGALYATIAITSIAVIGYLTSRHVPEAPAAAPSLKLSWNPISETIRNIRFAKQHRPVYLAIIGISWFWFYGAVFLSQFPGFAKQHLAGNQQVVTFLLAIFSVGIGAGSMMCDKISKHQVNPGLVLLGAIGLSLFAVDLYLAAPAHHSSKLGGVMQFIQQTGSYRVIFDLVMIGVAGGLYCVPLYTLMQTESDPAYRSRMIATNNLMNALFMVGSAIFAIALLTLHCTISTIFLITGLINLLVIAYLFFALPSCRQGLASLLGKGK